MARMRSPSERSGGTSSSPDSWLSISRIRSVPRPRSRIIRLNRVMLAWSGKSERSNWARGRKRRKDSRSAMSWSNSFRSADGNQCLISRALKSGSGAKPSKPIAVPGHPDEKPVETGPVDMLVDRHQATGAQDGTCGALAGVGRNGACRVLTRFVDHLYSSPSRRRSVWAFRRGSSRAGARTVAGQLPF